MFAPEYFPWLLVGLGAQRDDAAVYRVTEAVALIATLDLITPVVDDPYQYGAIAAANAMSDVYAMGGQVTLALNISCLSECLPTEIISEILRGGAEKVAEAGAALVGGHSVDDCEPKYGLVALGFVHPDRVWTKVAARVGDVLVLTKPLGVGLVTTAHKGGQASPEHMGVTIASMLKLNKRAAELLQQEGGVYACTDVTGFALLGHGCEVAEKSGVRLRIYAKQVPFLPGAKEYADMWLFPAGTAHNQHGYSQHVHCDVNVEEEVEQLLYTPETSGGLLAAVAAERIGAIEARFKAGGEPLWIIGEVVPREGEPLIELRP